MPTGDDCAPRALAHRWAVRLAGATTLPNKACRREVGAKVLCGEAARRIWPLLCRSESQSYFGASGEGNVSLYIQGEDGRSGAGKREGDGGRGRIGGVFLRASLGVSLGVKFLAMIFLMIFLGGS